MFSRFGTVIDVVIVDEYGFVNMASASDALTVVEELNGRGLHSSLLHVDLSEEMKQYLLNQGTTFRCSPDPFSGVVGEMHPRYPDGEGIVQPVITDTGFVSLLDNKEFLDERLKMINAELDKLKDSSEVSGTQRSRSRDGGSSKRRSRSRSRNKRGRRSRSRGRRSTSLRRRDSTRATDSRSRHSPKRVREHRRRSRSSSFKTSRIPHRGEYEYRRSKSPAHARLPSPQASRISRSPLNFNLHRSKSPDFQQFYPDRRSRTPLFGERLRTPDLYSHGHRSTSPGYGLAQRSVSPRYNSRIRSFSPGVQHKVAKPVHARLGKKVTDIESYDIVNPEDESDLDLSDVSEDYRRPSKEFEDVRDIDISKQNMKIQINIGSKSVDDMTRKIMVDQELRLNRPTFKITCFHKLDAAPKLPLDFLVDTFEVKDEPNMHTNLNIKSDENTAREVYTFLVKTGPIGGKVHLMNEEGYYVLNNGKSYKLHIIDPSHELRDMFASRRNPGSAVKLLKKYGVISDFYVNDDIGVVNYSNIYPEDMMTVYNEVKVGLLDRPYNVYVDPCQDSGKEFNKELLLKDPEAHVLYQLHIEGLRYSTFVNKHEDSAQKKIMSLFKPYGAVSFISSKRNCRDVWFLCSRTEAKAICLDMTNKVVFGNRLYVSAKNSSDLELKKDVEDLLAEKYGKELKDELKDDLVVNRKEPDAVDPEAQAKVQREIDFFVDGVRGTMNKEDFEELFNDYGMVIHEHHKEEQRFSFVTLITTEELALKACEEVTGTKREDNTLVVEISQRERHELASKSKMVARNKISTMRKQEIKEIEEELAKDEPGGVKKFYYYVDGITSPLTKYEVASIFQPYGKVLRALPTEDKYFTFVDLETTEESAIDAFVDITGREFFGNSIRVQFREA